MSRFVKPVSVRLPISGGDFVDVKKRLNFGETEEMKSRMLPYMTPGEPLRVESREVRLAKVLAYLIGWSLTDDGKPVAMSPDLSVDARIATINNLDPDTFSEIHTAIDEHEDKEEKAREAAKNAPVGVSASSEISS